MNAINAHFQVDRDEFQLNIKLSLPEQGVSALFGHSGSGKTTCLRAMAGLEHLPNSYLKVGDEVWQDEQQGIFVPPHQRDIGYVFQEASLFQHLSVLENLNFGLQRIDKEKRQVDFNHICEILSITQLLDRMPASLSGGESQRVAIARALLTSPKLLLMDEPLSALDHTLKQEVLPYLERLQQSLSIPIIYVSHSPDEVARLADYIAIIKEGELVRSGELAQVMLESGLAGHFYDGDSSLLFGEVMAHRKDYLTELALGEVKLLVPQVSLPAGTNLRCRINAKDVSLCLSPPLDSSISNVIPGVVTAIAQGDNPGECVVTIRVAPQQSLLATITYASSKRLKLELGSYVWAQIKSVVVL